MFRTVLCPSSGV